jgi:hypothetical protein
MYIHKADGVGVVVLERVVDLKEKEGGWRKRTKFVSE